jgi:hypothetical protein
MSRIDALLARETEDHLGKKVAFKVPLTAYPTKSEVIIINSPGSGEYKDGRSYRWAKLARHLQERELGTMVTYNAPRPDWQVQLPWEPYSHQGVSWNQLLVESLAHVVEFSLERAAELCGTASPTIYLSGFSSGGSAVGAVAFRYQEIKRILLLSTYDSVGDYFYDGVVRFPGDIYMAYGAKDPMAGFLAYILSCGPMAANFLKAREVPECDHRFSGATNSKVLTKAFLWAFDGDESFPSPEGGFQLYE